MTAATAAHEIAGGTPHGRLRDAVAAEWTKLWSVRSTWWTLAVATVLAVGIAALASLDQPIGAAPQVSTYALTGFAVAQFALLLVAILAVTAEYGTGSITSSLQWVPRRWRLLAAKAIVTVGVTSAVSVLLVIPAAAASAAVLGDRAVLDAAALVREGAVAAGFMALIAALGLGVGTALRSTAGTLTVLTLLLFVLPNLLGSLPNPVTQKIAEVLPGTAAVVLLGGITEPYAAGTAWAVLAAWGVAALAGGGVVLRQRDA